MEGRWQSLARPVPRGDRWASRRRCPGRALHFGLALLLALAGLATLTPAQPTRANGTGTVYTVEEAYDFFENPSVCSVYEAVIAAETNQDYGGCPAGSSTAEDVIEWQCNYLACVRIISYLPPHSWSSWFRPITGDGGPLRLRFTGGPQSFTVSGAPSFLGLFRVEDGGTLTLENVTFVTPDEILIVAYDANVTIIGSELRNSRGAIFAYNSTVTVRDSAFIGNQSDPEDGWEGQFGAIFMWGGSLEVTNSTFSANSTPESGESGSAIYLGSGATATLSFVTLADHTSGPALGVGGPEPSGTVRLKNVVLANPAVDECEAAAGLTVQVDGAVLADDPSCGSGVTFVSNLRNTLGNLAFNGGPTRTHALLTGSPAISAVPDGECSDWNDLAVSQDQRGQPRPNPSGTRCDAGAFESPEGTSGGGGGGTVDLAVSRLSVTRYSLETYDFTVTVKNTGSTPSPATTVVLRLNRTGSPTAGTVTATRSVPALAPGATYSFTVRRTVSDLSIKYAVAVVDPDNSVPETDETNNALARKFR
jgi:hypothetical protein